MTYIIENFGKNIHNINDICQIEMKKLGGMKMKNDKNTCPCFFFL